MFNLKNFPDRGKFLQQIDENLEVAIQYEISLDMGDTDPEVLTKTFRRHSTVFLLKNLESIEPVANLTNRCPEVTVKLLEAIENIFKNRQLKKQSQELFDFFNEVFDQVSSKDPVMFYSAIDNLVDTLQIFPELLQHREPFLELYKQSLAGNENAPLTMEAFLPECLKYHPEKANWYFENLIGISNQIDEICSGVKRSSALPDLDIFSSTKQEKQSWVSENMRRGKYLTELKLVLWALTAQYPDLIFPRLEAMKQVVEHLDDDAIMHLVEAIQNDLKNKSLTANKLTRHFSKIFESEN